MSTCPVPGRPSPTDSAAATNSDSAAAPSARAQAINSAAQFSIRSIRRAGTHIIAPCGELDAAKAPAFESELVAAEASDADRIVLDLSKLTFLDSSGLRTIVLAHARSKVDGNRLRLHRGPPQVQRIFEITATTNTLPFDD